MWANGACCCLLFIKIKTFYARRFVLDLEVGTRLTEVIKLADFYFFILAGTPCLSVSDHKKNGFRITWATDLFRISLAARLRPCPFLQFHDRAPKLAQKLRFSDLRRMKGLFCNLHIYKNCLRQSISIFPLWSGTAELLWKWWGKKHFFLSYYNFQVCMIPKNINLLSHRFQGFCYSWMTRVEGFGTLVDKMILYFINNIFKFCQFLYYHLQL